MTRSPSSRRAWIEIMMDKWDEEAERVALLAEGVDRNYSDNLAEDVRRVALLAEGVDRNLHWLISDL